MKTSFRVSLLAVVLATAGVAAGETLTQDLAPDVIEGRLAAAACVGADDQTAACHQRALAAGQPGGVLDGPRFTVLLIDGRILARTCAVGAVGRLRASGVFHQDGFAMSVFRLEQDCGQGWAIVDLPHAGTLADGAAGGDE
jgi:hypothetical protein